MSEDHDDFDFEPVPGLPAHLPAGEAILWQGSPEWMALAISAFHVRKIAAYFAVLAVWQSAGAMHAGEAFSVIATSTLWVAGGAAITIAMLCVLAWAYARGTIYTLTSKRIVIRSGLALPVTLNLPLALIETAALAQQPRGTGSIALTISKPNRIAWLVLWPNNRPWNFTNPKPMLRSLANVERVAPMLATALKMESGGARALMPSRSIEIDQVGVMPEPATATMAA